MKPGLGTLLHDRALLQALLDHSLDNIYFKDTQSRFLCIGRRMAARIGLNTPQEAVGRTDFDFFPIEHAQVAFDDEQQIMLTGIALEDKEEHLTWPDGQDAYYSTSKMPLRDDEGHIIGTFGVSRDMTERRRTQTDLHRTNAELKERMEELQQHHREALLLKEMGEALLRCETISEAALAVTQFVRQLFRSQAGSLYVLNKHNSLLERAASWEARPTTPAVFAPCECHVLKTGLPLVTAQGPSQFCKHMGYGEDQAHICLPLQTNGEMIGVIHLQTNEDHDNLRWGPLADAVVQHINLSFANLKLRQSIKEQSVRDPLTGLYNRRYFDQILTEEMQLASRRGLPLSVLFMDVDLFRNYNRDHGHEGGDRVLTGVAEHMLANLRRRDVLCRFGGDEFTLILPEASLADAMQVAEKLRQGIKTVQVEHRGEVIGGLTASIGAASFPLHGQTPEDLVRSADQALYRAKAAGRDCVVCAG